MLGFSFPIEPVVISCFASLFDGSVIISLISPGIITELSGNAPFHPESGLITSACVGTYLKNRFWLILKSEVIILKSLSFGGMYFRSSGQTGTKRSSALYCFSI